MKVKAALADAGAVANNKHLLALHDGRRNWLKGETLAVYVKMLNARNTARMHPGDLKVHCFDDLIMSAFTKPPFRDEPDPFDLGYYVEAYGVSGRIHSSFNLTICTSLHQSTRSIFLQWIDWSTPSTKLIVIGLPSWSMSRCQASRYTTRWTVVAWRVDR